MGTGRPRGEAPPSEREVEVLRAVARGVGNREAALALRVSEATVKRHLANVYPKLGARSRTEAVRVALSEGWIHPEELEPSGGGGGRVEERRSPARAATRWRCAEWGCGCEVVVVRGSGSPWSWGPFLCHGLPMVPVVPSDGRVGRRRRGSEEGRTPNVGE